MKDSTYIGVVEDNQDPQKLGRVKVRVLNIFDNLSLADIPWANPWKDLNGNGFNIPDKGKIVIVVFDKGDKNRPEFIYSDHYNDNLESKLKSLSDSSYLSMKSLIFDHRTQIYVNDTEGLKIDYKYNNVNITENTIDINLKDNNRNLNLGDAQASQQAILGNHWMDWFDEFVDNLLGSKAGPFLGNLGAPVIPNPSFISCLMKYKALRDPVFLSHHVNIVDNNKVTTVAKTKREDKSQIGDSWSHTKKENDMTTTTDEDFKPVEGPKKQSDDSPPPAATASTPSATPDANTTAAAPGGTNSTAPSTPEAAKTTPITESVSPPAAIPASSTESDPVLDKMIKFLKSKDYVVYDEPNILNIVAVRGKDDGTITNKFDDILYVFVKKDSGSWEMNNYEITTVPGFIPQSPTASESPRLPKNVPILALGQYIDQLKMSQYLGDTEHKCLEFEQSICAINTSVDKYIYTSPTSTDMKVFVKRGNKLGSSETVNNFSPDGSQCFKSMSQWNQFLTLCDTQMNTKQRFTYTLCRKSEFQSYIPTATETTTEPPMMF